MTRALLLSFAMLLGLMLTGVSAVAQDTAKPEPAKVGEPAPQFTLTDVVEGKEMSLADFKDQIVVVFWQSTTCPWNAMNENRGYERILKPFAKEWSERGVKFLAINSNKTESVESIKQHAQQAGLPYPILKDPGNKVADQYGAKTTPHFFVISKDDQTLLYKGGFEQVPVSPADCGHMDKKYLEPVLEAALAGETVPYTETPSKGCTIKRE